MLFFAPEEYTMSLEIPEKDVARPADRRPDWLTVAVALVLWRLFFPGLMSQDSIDQYGQALTGQYNDWHPPLMAIVLHLVFSLGGGIGLLMLGQCLAGVFGVRALAGSVIALLYGDRVPERRVAWLSLLALLALLVPVTPLAFYLMTFWKDAWAMILMLWIGALALDLLRLGASPKRLFLLIGLGAALGMVRHNAVVLLPVVGLMLWEETRRQLSRRFSRITALALAAAPLALYLAATPLIDGVFGVKALHPDSQVMALDLVGLCAMDRAEGHAVCPELPWTRAHIVDESALAAYRPGDIGFIFWDKPPHVEPSIRADYPAVAGRISEGDPGGARSVAAGEAGGVRDPPRHRRDLLFLPRLDHRQSLFPEAGPAPGRSAAAPEHGGEAGGGEPGAALDLGGPPGLARGRACWRSPRCWRSGGARGRSGTDVSPGCC